MLTSIMMTFFSFLYFAPDPQIRKWEKIVSNCLGSLVCLFFRPPIIRVGDLFSSAKEKQVICPFRKQNWERVGSIFLFSPFLLSFLLISGKNVVKQILLLFLSSSNASRICLKSWSFPLFLVKSASLCFAFFPSYS